MQVRPEDLIACGGGHMAVITQEGRVVCWGCHSNHQCDVPDGLENVVAVSCGGLFTAALTLDGKVWCWGANGFRQCEVPPELDFVVRISCGYLPYGSSDP
jgi:alpha-tubulin suppressor-like RCC1 family protein